MSEIVYKPYSVISKEWQSLCEQHRKAFDQVHEAQHGPPGKYPSNQWWDNLRSTQKNYDKIRSEMDHYRKTVRMSD